MPITTPKVNLRELLAAPRLPIIGFPLLAITLKNTAFADGIFLRWWRRRESPGLRACKRESASATAVTEVELLSLSRARFDQIAGNHKRLGVTLIHEVACVLASRLRQTNDELLLVEGLWLLMLFGIYGMPP